MSSYRGMNIAYWPRVLESKPFELLPLELSSPQPLQCVPKNLDLRGPFLPLESFARGTPLESVICEHYCSD
jgi:hypothetical protein